MLRTTTHSHIKARISLSSQPITSIRKINQSHHCLQKSNSTSNSRKFVFRNHSYFSNQCIRWFSSDQYAKNENTSKTSRNHLNQSTSQSESNILSTEQKVETPKAKETESNESDTKNNSNSARKDDVDESTDEAAAVDELFEARMENMTPLQKVKYRKMLQEQEERDIDKRAFRDALKEQQTADTKHSQALKGDESEHSEDSEELEVEEDDEQKVLKSGEENDVSDSDDEKHVFHDDYVDEEDIYRSQFIDRELAHSHWDGAELTATEIKEIEDTLQPHEVKEFREWRSIIQPINRGKDQLEQEKLIAMSKEAREEYLEAKKEREHNSIQQMNKWMLLIKQKRDLRWHHHIHSPERLEKIKDKYKWLDFDRMADYIQIQDKMFFDRQQRFISTNYDLTEDPSICDRSKHIAEMQYQSEKEEGKLFRLLPYAVWIDSGTHTNITHKGKMLSFWSLMVAGDKNGTAGWGIGKGIDVETAEKRAKVDLKFNLQFVPTVESRTIRTETWGKYGKVHIRIWPQERGRGMTAGFIPRIIFECFGFEDIMAKLWGGRKIKRHQVMCVFNALRGLVSEREEAVGRGVNMYRKYEHRHMEQRVPSREVLKARFQQVAHTLNKIKYEKLLLSQADAVRATIDPSKTESPKQNYLDTLRSNKDQMEYFLHYDPDEDNERTPAEKRALVKMKNYYREQVAQIPMYQAATVHQKPLEIPKPKTQKDRKTVLGRKRKEFMHG